ncbi:MAG: exodeoxyribonuclease V subunit gamma [Victivallales bacterium]|nr:exodeoxyribonuclease V subunit gamma [Victivallales bacterium]
MTKLAEAYVRNRQSKLGDYRSGGVLGREVVVVPTYGVAVWLEHHVVKHGMVSAGVDFPMLRPALCDLLQSSVAGYEAERFSPAALSWRIYAVLERAADELPAVLRNYLGKKDYDPVLRRYEFSKVAAQLFEEYQSYLPKTLDAWGRGELLAQTIKEDDGSLKGLEEKFRWQSWLWHRVCNPGQGVHLVSLAEAIVRFCALEDECQTSHPVTVFGASAMPPAFLDVLVAYSRHAPVNFYYRNPSREYWGDNLAKWQPGHAAARDALQAEFQNDLLANNAVQAQEFFRTIVDRVPQFGDMAVAAEAEEPEPATLLQRIQRQLLDNINPEQDRGEFPLGESDDSIVVYNCFNATREVEALRDALLYLLRKNPSYTMNDIIVMAPDISAFAPAIHAVFDNSPLNGQYSLSDRSLRQANLLAEGFLEILKLKDSHYEASKIIQLLDIKALRDKFGFSVESLQTIQEWLSKAEIRFDLDCAARAKYHFADEAYTWQLGLDRMLLALAVEPPEDGALGFADLAPQSFGDSEESRQTLGALCRLMRELPETVRQLNEKPVRSAREWRDLLMSIYEQYFAEDPENASDHLTLRKCIDDLAEGPEAAGFTGELPFSIVMSILDGALETAAPKTPFLQGRITCCSMMPMREVPCKVLAILGMDAGAFPHRDNAPGFTLLARGSKLPYYVRSRLQEDKYIFLEALQAVSDHLLIFYHGQDDKNPDDSASKLPPAPLVEELLSYLDRAVSPSGDPAQRPGAALVVRQRLNAFDPENFRTEGTSITSLRQHFSFDERNAAVARTAEAAILQKESGAAIFNLEIPSESPFLPKGGVVELQLPQLERFFKNPVGDFLVNRMNFNRRYDDDVKVEDVERFAVVDGLEKWQLKNEVFAAKINGQSLDEVLNRLRRTSRLPLGPLASQALEAVAGEVKMPEEELLEPWKKQSPRKFILEVEIPSNLMDGLDFLSALRTAEARVNGSAPFTARLHAQFQVSEDGGGIAAVCHGKLTGRQLIGPYLKWLVLAACAGDSRQPPFLRVICTKTSGEILEPFGEGFSGEPAAEARHRLSRLLQIFLLGQFMPIPPLVERHEDEEADIRLVLGEPPSDETLEIQQLLTGIVLADFQFSEGGEE